MRQTTLLPSTAPYLRRIGYAGALSPSLETLKALHEVHVGSIPFENIDVLLERPIRLDDENLHRKLIEEKRGGYCFEHNLLFSGILTALGFSVRWLAARVLPGTTILPRTHMALLVELEETSFLVDVGFGATGLLEPIPLVNGYELELPIVSFRLIEDGNSWLLQSLQENRWSDQYCFTLEPQERADYEMANYYTSTYPSSIFRHTLTAQLTRREERLSLRNREFTILRSGSKQLREIRSPDEAKDVLAEYFNLNLPKTYMLPEAIFREQT